eukprot:scpid84643/ scgid4834/ 
MCVFHAGARGDGFLSYATRGISLLRRHQTSGLSLLALTISLVMVCLSIGLHLQQVNTDHPLDDNYPAVSNTERLHHVDLRTLSHMAVEAEIDHALKRAKYIENIQAISHSLRQLKQSIETLKLSSEEGAIPTKTPHYHLRDGGTEEVISKTGT